MCTNKQISPLYGDSYCLADDNLGLICRAQLRQAVAATEK